MNGSFSIRDAVPGDLDAVRSLFRRSSLSNRGDRDNLLAHPDALELSGGSVDEGRMRVAIDADGHIVGFVTTAGLAGALELEDLFVDPEHMRRGIARGLVLDVVARAQRIGMTRIEVTANEHARSFYDSVGFVFDHGVTTRFGPAPRMVLQIEPPAR